MSPAFSSCGQASPHQISTSTTRGTPRSPASSSLGHASSSSSSSHGRPSSPFYSTRGRRGHTSLIAGFFIRYDLDDSHTIDLCPRSRQATPKTRSASVIYFLPMWTGDPKIDGKGAKIQQPNTGGILRVEYASYCVSFVTLLSQHNYFKQCNTYWKQASIILTHYVKSVTMTPSFNDSWNLLKFGLKRNESELHDVLGA